jgi:hypothetical protein
VVTAGSCNYSINMIAVKVAASESLRLSMMVIELVLVSWLSDDDVRG